MLVYISFVYCVIGGYIQSNLSYLGTLGLGGAHNSDLSVSQNTIYIGCNRPHPLYCPQFLQCCHKIGQICCPVEGGARILDIGVGSRGRGGGRPPRFLV